MLTTPPRTDPTEIYRYRDGLYAVDLLTAAIVEWDFFTWLRRQEMPPTLDEITRALGLQRRPVDVMLTLFVAERYLERTSDGRYRLTPLAGEHLVSDSPFFIGPYFASLRERPVVKDFIQILRTDRPANWGSYQHEKAWSEAMLTEEFATRFTAAMDCRGVTLGQALAASFNPGKRRRLLDIAGGSGIYACALVARHPGLQATVFERAPVDQIARTMIGRRGFSDRVQVAAGDMFRDPLPAGHEVHLYSNVLHDWDEERVRQLVAASFAALPPDGLLLIHDAHLDREKAGPLPVAKYSALLMSVTEGRCYSIGEMEEYLGACGFVEIRYTPTVADRSVIVARKPV